MDFKKLCHHCNVYNCGMAIELLNASPTGVMCDVSYFLLNA
jgi:hypothetical protein